MRAGKRKGRQRMENTILYQVNAKGEEKGLIALFLANREGDNRTESTIHFYRQRLTFFCKWLSETGKEETLFFCSRIQQLLRPDYCLPALVSSFSGGKVIQVVRVR